MPVIRPPTCRDQINTTIATTNDNLDLPPALQHHAPSVLGGGNKEIEKQTERNIEEIRKRATTRNKILQNNNINRKDKKNDANRKEGKLTHR